METLCIKILQLNTLEALYAHLIPFILVYSVYHALSDMLLYIKKLLSFLCKKLFRNFS